MSSMSKKIISNFYFLLLCFVSLFCLISESYAKADNFKNQNFIEEIPFPQNLIENKIDAVEFDSSNGKIILITFDIKNLSKNQIFSFYRDFFEEKKWKKDENKNVWEIRNERFKKKIFKIENFENNILTIKIIVENF